MGDTIIGVQFGIANPQEIIARSARQKSSLIRLTKPSSLYQVVYLIPILELLKMARSATCKQTNILCPGHFGHIQLARPVYLLSIHRPNPKDPFYCLPKLLKSLPSQRRT